MGDGWGTRDKRIVRSWSECLRYTAVGVMFGATVGGAVGTIEYASAVRQMNPRPALRPLVGELTKTAAKRSAVTALFFSSYHAVLCSMRASQVAKDYGDWPNVAAASAVAFAPFYRQRQNFITFGMLIVLDNLNSISGA